MKWRETMPKDRKNPKSDKEFNFKERPAMFAFGQLILPILALVAVGILFLGVKLFFLTPGGVPSTAQSPVVLEPLPAISAEPAPESAADVSTPQTSAGANVILAEPVDPTKQTSSGTQTKQTKTPAKTRTSSAKVTTPKKPSRTSQPSSVTRSVAASSVKGAWEVQIGSFSQKSAAETLAAKALQGKYSSRVVEGLVGNKRWYRVRVAAGNDRAKANSLAAELEAKGYPVLVVPAN